MTDERTPHDEAEELLGSPLLEGPLTPEQQYIFDWYVGQNRDAVMCLLIRHFLIKHDGETASAVMVDWEAEHVRYKNEYDQAIYFTEKASVGVDYISPEHVGDEDSLS